MNQTIRQNPLKADALTADTIKPGRPIKYWTPGDSKSVRVATPACQPYMDPDGDLVIDLIHPDGHQSTELTSAVGLTGERYTGVWRAIAIDADEE